MANIIVHGRSFQVIAVTSKAANNTLSNSVIVIVPYIVSKSGGITTVTEQNYWDMREWNNILRACSQLCC